MNTRSLVSRVLKFLLIVLLLAPWLHDVPALAASGNSGTDFAPAFLVGAQPIFSDFDGDNKIDGATFSSSGRFKSIQVALGKSAWRSLSFDSNESERGMLVSGDIDADGDIDLVWISQSARKFIAWLGDGRGNFSIGTDPRLTLDRIRSLLLQDGSQRLGQGADAPEIAVVQVHTHLVVPTGNGYPLYLSQQGSVPPSQTLAVSVASLLAPPQRGPPSRLF